METSINITRNDLNDLIGTGDDAVVWDTHLRRPNTVFKEYKKQDVLQSVKYIPGLNHRNVVQVLSMQTQDPIGMLLAKGSGNLQEFSVSAVSESFFAFDINKWRVQICRDIIQGLIELRRHNLCHGNLKTRNVILNYDASANDVIAKITDYGMKPHADFVTLAPECKLGKEYTEKSDVYSFGLLMWELLFQQPVSDGFLISPETSFSISSAHREFHEVLDYGTSATAERPILPLELPSDESAVLYITLMTDCWSEDPAARPNYETILNALQSIVEFRFEPPFFSTPKSELHYHRHQHWIQWPQWLSNSFAKTEDESSELYFRGLESVLHFAVRKQWPISTVEQVIAYQKDVNVQDITLNTPLHRASQNGSQELAALLQKNGAKNNIKNIDGLCP